MPGAGLPVPPPGREPAPRPKPAAKAPRSPPAGPPPTAVPPSPPAASSASPPTVPPPPGELTLIGSGHVFQVRDTIRQAVLALRPDIVFVELDRGRLHALVQRQQAGAQGSPPPQPPASGFVQKKLQSFQEQVAGLYGADVGEEMLAAVQAGQEIGARIALIDPPAEDTVRRVLKELTWREKLRAGGLVIGGGFQALFKRSGSRGDIEAEIRKYQEDPGAALDELKAKFPTLHRIVIAERDALMARRIAKLLAGARHGVAVVGDGHMPGLLALLDDLHPKAYRLADVREGRLPRPPASLATGTTTDVRFGFDAQT